jgi:sugar/nucleoside kinase (ribokinase family)
VKKKVKRSKILIISGFTIDEIQGKSKPGGPLIYSALGVMRGGGIPKLYGIVGKDFNFELDFLSNVEKHLIIDEYTIRFNIELFNNNRKLTLLKKPLNKIKIPKDDTVNGILINPVCKEIELNELNLNIPIALDIQGLIRDCVENKEIDYESNLTLPKSNSYLVLHANIEEFRSSKLSLRQLFELGFKEVIISDGKNGFNIYTNNQEIYTYRPNRIGKNEIGTGDFLIGAYFSLRVSGFKINDASLIAGKLTEEFSNSEFLI